MDDKDGITAWAAIRLLFPEPELEQGGITYIDTEYDENLWPNSAVPSFQDLLLKGRWRAKGRRVPVNSSARREHIQLDLWDILDIDLKNNSASGGGLEYVGLRFFKKKTVEKPASRESVRFADLKRFMEKRIAGLIEAGEQSSARHDETAARAHFKDRSINREWIKQFRQEFDVAEKWSKRGPRN